MDKATQEEVARIENRTASLASKDGTTIQYRALGKGPGLVILAGSMQTSRDYLLLAAQLTDRFTLYIPDRRGRGGSGPQGADYTLQKECEDAIRLLDLTQSSFLFGHSYGGLIALNVARQYPLSRLAVYDAPVSINNSLPREWIPQYEREVARKDYAGAMVTLIYGLQLGGKMSFIPSFVFRWLMRRVLDADELAELGQIMPTVPPEAQQGALYDSDGSEYAAIGATSLLMIGGESPAYFPKAASILEKMIPAARQQVYAGLDHGTPNTAPEKIAPAIGAFFGN